MLVNVSLSRRKARRLSLWAIKRGLGEKRNECLSAQKFTRSKKRVGTRTVQREKLSTGIVLADLLYVAKQIPLAAMLRQIYSLSTATGAFIEWSSCEKLLLRTFFHVCKKTTPLSLNVGEPGMAAVWLTGHLRRYVQPRAYLVNEWLVTHSLLFLLSLEPLAHQRKTWKWCKFI